MPLVCSFKAPGDMNPSFVASWWHQITIYHIQRCPIVDSLWQTVVWNVVFVIENIFIVIQMHWNLFLGIQLPTGHYSFRKWSDMLLPKSLKVKISNASMCHCWLNSLAPWRRDRTFINVISKGMLRIKFMITSSGIALRRLPHNTSDDKSTLV